MARRLNTLRSSAPPGSPAARLLQTSAADVATRLAGVVPADATDGALNDALAAHERREPSAFAVPGVVVVAPERLSPTERAAVAKLDVMGRLALANRKAEAAAKKKGQP